MAYPNIDTERAARYRDLLPEGLSRADRERALAAIRAGEARAQQAAAPTAPRKSPRRTYLPASSGDQLLLGLLAHVPVSLTGHGLRRVHVAPRVGGRTLAGEFWSGRKPVTHAFGYSHVDLADAGPVVAAMTFDCDHEDGEVLAGLPEHSWLVETERGFHATWCFAAPPAVHENARIKPVRFLQRIQEYYHHHLRADPAFSGLGRNPEHEAAVVHWGAVHPYRMATLAAPIPKDWRRPRKPLTTVGRNCDVFLATCRVCGADLDADPLEITRSLNPKISADLDKPPMEDAEVQGIARSVERYRAQWRQQPGGHKPAWLARQAARGRRGGRPRLYEEGAEPWTLEGIHRSTWYRRRARATKANTGTGPQALFHMTVRAGAS